MIPANLPGPLRVGEKRSCLIRGDYYPLFTAEGVQVVEVRVQRNAPPAAGTAHLLAQAPSLLRSLAALVALIESDPEANTPGTDLHVETTIAKLVIADATKADDK